MGASWRTARRRTSCRPAPAGSPACTRRGLSRSPDRPSTEPPGIRGRAARHSRSSRPAFEVEPPGIRAYGDEGDSDQPKVLDRVALLDEPGRGGIHPAAGEVVDLEPLDDLPVTVRRGD